MVTLPAAQAPDGMRLYAIGDVHGCSDRLAEVHARIGNDLASRPVADWRVIHLGDYVDRGPDSAGVLRMLLDYGADGRAEFLLGNHDAFLIGFLADPAGPVLDVWIENGGAETFESFGIDSGLARQARKPAERQRLREALESALPSGLARFLSGVVPMVRHGDYAFVHAGVRPGVAMDQQSRDDLLWIREPFLSSTRWHGRRVVHGHTVTLQPDVRDNRIGIDTGAYASGRLTVLAIEGPTIRFLDTVFD